MRMKKILLLCICIASLTAGFSQKVITIGDTNSRFDFINPKEYEIGAIRVQGADNFDHQGIRLISGLRVGEKIKIPGEPVFR